MKLMIQPVNLLVNVSCCIFSYRGGSEMVFPWKEKCCPSNGSNRNKSDSKQKSIVKTDATLDGNSSCKIINNENWFLTFLFYSFHTDCILLVRNTITSLIMTHNIVWSQMFFEGVYDTRKLFERGQFEFTVWGQFEVTYGHVIWLNFQIAVFSALDCTLVVNSK